MSVPHPGSTGIASPITLPSPLAAVEAEIAQLVRAIFVHADEGTAIALRSFTHDKEDQRPRIHGFPVLEADPSSLIQAATKAATESAQSNVPLVFCPPLATFQHNRRAREIDLANGLCLSVEMDQGDTAALRGRLEHLLGPVTLAVASGGEWMDPKTGELHPKLHCHWRLSEPTRTPEDHLRLKQARDLAASYVGSDTSAVPLVHPLRWPGSWHRKDRPRLAMVQVSNPSAELHLDDALTSLTEAVEATGLREAGVTDTPRVPGVPQADIARLRPAVMLIPNTLATDWHAWNDLGLLIHRATGGSDDGLELWIDWSMQSARYVAGECQARWLHFHDHGYDRAGAGTIFYRARSHGWNGPPMPEPPSVAPEKPSEEEELPDQGLAAIIPELEGFELSEDGIALAFAALHKDQLRYDHTRKSWFRWTGTVWRVERTQLAYSWARQLCRRLKREADPDARGLAALSKANTAAAVERNAASDETFSVTSDIWDRDPFLLNTPAGTVDLTTGIVRPARQADSMAKQTAVAPADTADCPLWTAFLDQATGGDKAVILFLQQWCGYCLTGSTREHSLMFIFGEGGNGKSVFLNTVAGIMGDYAMTAGMEVFTASKHDRHPQELARLQGARMVTASETEHGKAWAETRINQLTGGDPITARLMHQNDFTFRPEFKLFVIGNNKPSLKNVNDAARRRFNLLNFQHRPAKEDRHLEEKLRAEWPGILRWMLQGCIYWQKAGLHRPEAVTITTAEYFDAQDFFARWLAECCDLNPTKSTKPSRLLLSFNQWCQANGEPTQDNRGLRGMIERTRGLRYATNGGIQWVRGIGVRDGPPDGKSA